MRKSILIITSILLLSSYSFASIPPEAVKKAFDQKFPKATNIKWDKENAKEWEAEFVFNGNKVSANFSNNGAWLETESTIAVIDLPKAVANAIKASYSDWTITEADKTETVIKGTIYEIVLKKAKDKKEVTFKEDGTSVK